MPALDFAMIQQLDRDLHTQTAGVMSEEQICPWTLFLTMALTLLKGVLPHVPKMLPLMISDPEMRERVADTFTSAEFIDNIEEYFVENIKSDIQTPINRQIIKSSETIMYFIDVFEGLTNAFFSSNTNTKDNVDNDLGTTDNRPRSDSGPTMFEQVLNFATTLYNLSK